MQTVLVATELALCFELRSNVDTDHHPDLSEESYSKEPVLGDKFGGWIGPLDMVDILDPLSLLLLFETLADYFVIHACINVTLFFQGLSL